MCVEILCYDGTLLSFSSTIGETEMPPHRLSPKRAFMGAGKAGRRIGVAADSQPVRHAVHLQACRCHARLPTSAWARRWARASPRWERSSRRPSAWTCGCGMESAAKTGMSRTDLPEDLSDIRKAIEHQIPLSAGRYNASVKKTAKPRIERLEARAEELGRLEFYDKTSRNWRKQLGSLGSGNHFIEIVLDEEGRRLGVPALRARAVSATASPHTTSRSPSR